MGMFKRSLMLAVFLTLLWIIPGLELASAQDPADGVPEGYMIIEGDIIVPEDFFDGGGIGIQSVFGDTQFWTNGIVPFVFDANVTPANQTLMIAAMADWENVANVDFRLRNGEANYVRVQNSTENSSHVGMQGGEQVINIFNWNDNFIIVHELGHTLGLWHEQSRPDRDHYVTINWDNIQSGLASQFEMRIAADVYAKRAYGLADDQTYDFDSVMHYDACAFSIDCPAGWSCMCTKQTITVPPPNQAWQNQIGQRNHLSRLDRLTMSFLYPKANWRFVDKTHTGTQTGTFLEPFTQFTSGMNGVPSGGTLWIQPGTYLAVGTYDRPLTLQAPLGHVVLGQ